MTYAEAIKAGFKRHHEAYFQGYVSRKVNEQNQPLKKAGGMYRKKGLYYVELPCWHSSRYAIRLYLTPPEEGRTA